jgi:hypothetical protein
VIGDETQQQQELANWKGGGSSNPLSTNQPIPMIGTIPTSTFVTLISCGVLVAGGITVLIVSI